MDRPSGFQCCAQPRQAAVEQPSHLTLGLVHVAGNVRQLHAEETGVGNDLALVVGEPVQGLRQPPEVFAADGHAAWSEQTVGVLAGQLDERFFSARVALLPGEVHDSVLQLAGGAKEEPLPEGRFAAVLEASEIHQYLATDGLREVFGGLLAAQRRPHAHAQEQLEGREEPHEQLGSCVSVAAARVANQLVGIRRHAPDVTGEWM